MEKFFKIAKPVFVLFSLMVSTALGCDSYFYVLATEGKLLAISAGLEKGCLMFVALMALGSLLEYRTKEFIKDRQNKKNFNS